VTAALSATRRSVRAETQNVVLGAITYSFRTLPSTGAVIQAMQSIGFTEVELMFNHAEQLLGAPSGRGTPANALREWRTTFDVDRYAGVKKAFADAGMNIRVLCFNMPRSISDPEIDYAFRMAKVLGAGAISTTAQVSTAKRIAPLADKHQLRVGFHGHDNTSDPDEFATPESFAAAMALSRFHGVNLDIGHFVAAGYDPVAYIGQHHDRITNLHIKDRNKNHGPNMPFGRGETPIVEVLQLLKKNGWPIPANIEFEYAGDPLVEVPKCLDFCRRAIA
jgi:sugar phosphate isomerase/epimerase